MGDVTLECGGTLVVTAFRRGNSFRPEAGISIVSGALLDRPFAGIAEPNLLGRCSCPKSSFHAGWLIVCVEEADDQRLALIRRFDDRCDRLPQARRAAENCLADWNRGRARPPTAG